jgi:hypothetical protein
MNFDLMRFDLMIISLKIEDLIVAGLTWDTIIELIVKEVKVFVSFPIVT